MNNTLFGMLDYGARMYDPVIIRYGVLDRFAEKYSSLSPYSYCAGNPISFVDVNGDSVSVSSQIAGDDALKAAFNQFATSKAGQNFLANYAAKGQTIAGYTYEKDGKYHTGGVNLVYTAKYFNTKRGETSTSENGTITVTLNSSPIVSSQDGSTYGNMIGTAVNAFESVYNDTNPFYVMSKAITLFHESFIHADLFAKDYMDNHTFDYSNIPQNILDHNKFYKGSDMSHVHHLNVQLNSNNDLWPGSAYKGIIEVNSSLGLRYTNSQLKTMMWNYNGGLEK